MRRHTRRRVDAEPPGKSIAALEQRALVARQAPDPGQATVSWAAWLSTGIYLPGSKFPLSSQQLITAPIDFCLSGALILCEIPLVGFFKLFRQTASELSAALNEVDKSIHLTAVMRTGPVIGELHVNGQVLMLVDVHRPFPRFAHLQMLGHVSCLDIAVKFVGQ
ncbi:hypothetical protein ABIA30_000133 [Mycobacterium sp. MAA66]|uniref:hypothetical protein n=1 Tax=Mycobacterium sp. MAA66 TaxID=3156297 RepID=UPI003519D49C